MTSLADELQRTVSLLRSHGRTGMIIKTGHVQAWWSCVRDIVGMKVAMETGEYLEIYCDSVGIRAGDRVKIHDGKVLWMSPDDELHTLKFRGKTRAVGYKGADGCVDRP